MNHEELVGLAKSNFSGISFEYEGDAVPVLSPCRFTGSDVRYLEAYFINLIWVSAAIIYHHYFSSFQIRMRDDGLPLAHVAIAVEGASVASPDIVPLMVANCIIGSYDLTYGGGKVGEGILAHTVMSKGRKCP